MGYPSPTTVSQMYEILKQIYYDYRLNITEYQPVNLKDLKFNRLTYTEKTDEELREEARILFMPWFHEQFQSRYNDAQVKMMALTEQIKKMEETRQEELDKVRATYDKEINSYKDQAVKKGLASSSIYLNRLSEMESEKASAIQKKDNEIGKQIQKLNGDKIDVHESTLFLEEQIGELLECKISAKVIELKKEQENHRNEVFKYNTSLEEKEMRSKNSNLSANASLTLKYLEIRSKAFSKEDLVNIGYYEQVIKCVCAYYNTITDKIVAYQNLLHEEGLMIYLEEYYNPVLELYRARATS